MSLPFCPTCIVVEFVLLGGDTAAKRRDILKLLPVINHFTLIILHFTRTTANGVATTSYTGTDAEYGGIIPTYLIGAVFDWAVRPPWRGATGPAVHMHVRSTHVHKTPETFGTKYLFQM